ncbi:MAG: hypothetical protein AVDCRST_MAG43-1507 [uncultured Thermomicrobiales bacterium]|uniref:Asparagine synthetase domain-containing protein n=1 Tax=uncultured Thermomicrobiales bacterium TaxID=1645740 RepID=A0A6J4UU14_9BACT|nr:MAG: hypothetical protein AVDCRST_MAG43-1507 [uncultured Thermomicrobiales bacterium]
MANRLTDALRTAVATRNADVLLLSGGLDSSFLAGLLATSGRPLPPMITVGLAGEGPCPAHAALPYPCNGDLASAAQVAEHLDLDWRPLRLDVGTALANLDDLMRLRTSFDLGLLNDIPIIAGLRHARSLGARSFWTGDDADTLFGGYQFLRPEEDWSAFLAGRIPTIEPPARAIGTHFGMTPVFPFLAPDVLAIAQSLSWNDVHVAIPVEERALPPSFVDQLDRDLMASPERPWGKVILRRIAEEVLPDAIAWRPKTDLEFGSGMCALETSLAELVSLGERERLDQTPIRWFNDAHRGMHTRFEALGLRIPSPGPDDYACTSCGGGVRKGRRHCPTCGTWPADSQGKDGSRQTTTSR